jgi:DNA-binding response OmpR family regulator
VLLPRIDCIDRAADPLRPPSPYPSGARVLLVEDNDALRDVMTNSLEAFGYEVISARTAERGLELACQHRRGLDVLLIEVRLRGVLGTELAHRIIDTVGTLPVLFVSPFPPSPGTAEADADNLLVKPFTAHELAARVRETLSIPLAREPASGPRSDSLRR